MLTERDMTIARWIGRQGAVRAEHVMTRFSIGRTATYRRLHELIDFGLVRRHRLLYNDGGLLTATAEGLRCAGLDRLTPARISLALVPHMIASAALAAEIEPRLDGQTLLSDREHRAAENAAGEPIASAIVGRQSDGRAGLHRPDFALIAQGGQHVIAVEVELTLKNRTRIERILRGYLRNQNVSVVRYHAVEPIGDAVRRAARAVGAEAIVELAPLPVGAHVDDSEPIMSDAIVPLDHQLLTADEVAELLRLPVSTIYGLARTGRLPHLKIGRALRFSRSDLEAHLAERCRAHVAARA